ncbi:helix-turn-helix transcriptional regulator [Saccharothrix obliqua]|uniref:helix-turn-helix transcriptional regulator n=1 Tax=Saccharothrix obliqua TaxID=2861747 RepID=UPI001C5E8A33|nr:helix-turn-helix transcriptional regulator [Saccharothrix obliqua]MBW4720006.1 helix-turn-helix transcriptional regulator [Saccharothrix obliqua]
MVEDSGVDELLRQWAAERSDDAELREVNRIKDEWLAEAPPRSAPGIPVQRANGGPRGLVRVESADPAYVAAMRKRAPEVPDVLLAAAASYWQLVGDLTEAERWWDAGISPLDQRALDYRAAGLTPADLGRRLGPMTVLQHLRRGSAAAWCVARLQRQRRDGVA